MFHLRPTLHTSLSPSSPGSPSLLPPPIHTSVDLSPCLSSCASKTLTGEEWVPHATPEIREGKGSPPCTSLCPPPGNTSVSLWSEVQPSVPRPLSPTRLQPVVAPEAQSDAIPDLEELLRIRSEIPRALKRRGSSDLPQPLKKASHYQPNQYKNLIDKLFTKKKHKQQGEQGSETSSSSDGEDCAMPPATLPWGGAPLAPPPSHSIHRQLSPRSGKRARLSPLVLLLDGALVGELETVQRAVLEVSDHWPYNAVCGGHYNVVDFLVRIGANVSAPDSHGWTPLHCAASCNDRPLCEFLVRSGAAVMAMTESDGAVASQKCDPYASGFDECEKFLRGIEEAMGVDNSGVLYALWSYPAQASDELSFKEGDMVTILQKPEGAYWWWASLCGREGLVPNNYFGVRSVRTFLPHIFLKGFCRCFYKCGLKLLKCIY
uniref:Protein phosphatase 1, regulatory subunit 13 like n=1 Tax=Gouania willdenowi TaxID=441366 RepID=A0A8C5HFH7_GOUWI